MTHSEWCTGAKFAIYGCFVSMQASTLLIGQTDRQSWEVKLSLAVRFITLALYHSYPRMQPAVIL